jgi:phosphatidylinositol-3-phosphatase
MGNPVAFSPVQRACPNCGTPVDVDQRYCVACGERQAELPARVREMLGLQVAAAPVVPPFAQPEVAVAAADTAGRIGWFTLPRPRDMAIAVLAVLGFGVVVGTAVSPAATNSAAPTILVYAQPPAAAPQDTSTADTGFDDTSVPAPVAVAPTVVAAAPAPAPAPVQKQGKQPTAPPTPTTPTTPPIKHVFLIVLSDQGFNQAFGGASTAPYLSKTLTAQGELLTNYYAVAQGNLANSVALISGQGPTISTTQNCPTFTDIAPGTVDKDGQVIGDGCAYPKTTQTIGDELVSGGHTWKAYVQGMGTGADGKPATCRAPAAPADPNAAPVDPAATAAAPLDAYSAAHNPWVFFHSVTDTPLCANNDVGIEQLDTDLKTETTTPSLSYIVPDLCHNGSDTPCAPDQPAGLPQADAFLKDVVPKIMDSDAYKNGGMIAITFDQAQQTGPNADASACCETPAYPNLVGYTPPAATPATDPTATTPVDPNATPVDPNAAPADPNAAAAPVDPTATAPADPSATPPADPAAAPTTTAPADPTVGLRAPKATAAQFGGDSNTPTSTSTTPATTTPTAPVDTTGLPTTPTGGGGHVGMLLLSPYVKPATTSAFSYYNHFSFLRSVEQLFGVQELGYSNVATLSTFDATVYTNPTGEPVKDTKAP